MLTCCVRIPHIFVWFNLYYVVCVVVTVYGIGVVVVDGVVC